MKSALRQRPLPAAGWGIVAILGYVALLIVVLIGMILLAFVFGLLGFSDLIGINFLGGTRRDPRRQSRVRGRRRVCRRRARRAWSLPAW